MSNTRTDVTFLEIQQMNRSIGRFVFVLDVSGSMEVRLKLLFSLFISYFSCQEAVVNDLSDEIFPETMKLASFQSYGSSRPIRLPKVWYSSSSLGESY